MLNKQQAGATGQSKSEQLERIIPMLEHLLKELLQVADVQILVDVGNDDL